MKVILLQDIKGVGKKDEVINASDGYARNFLLPKKMGIEANAENMSKLKAKQDSNQYKKSVEKEKAQEIAEKLKNITLKISVKTGENQKIFGSITAKEIEEADCIIVAADAKVPMDRFAGKKVIKITSKKVNVVVRKLKPNKTYYVKARAYEVVNGKKVYGNWSKAKKIKNKK